MSIGAIKRIKFGVVRFLSESCIDFDSAIVAGAFHEKASVFIGAFDEKASEYIGKLLWVETLIYHREELQTDNSRIRELLLDNVDSGLEI